MTAKLTLEDIRQMGRAAVAGIAHRREREEQRKRDVYNEKRRLRRAAAKSGKQQGTPTE